MTAFVDYQLAHCPPWLLGPHGRALQTILGEAKRIQADRASYAVTARMADIAPADALDRIGADRRIFRAPGESDDVYRTRLVQAFDFHRLAGTIAGLEAGFAALGLSCTVIEDQAVGGALGHWARFAIATDGTGIIDGPALWGSFTWGDGTRWGTSSGAEIDYLRSIINLLKPARCRCVGLLIFRDGFDPLVIAVDDLTIGYDLADVVSSWLDSYLPTWTV